MTVMRRVLRLYNFKGNTVFHWVQFTCLHTTEE